jgi:hypothetical protein
MMLGKRRSDQGGVSPHAVMDRAQEPGAAGDLIAMKDGAKFIVAFGSATDQAPIAVPQLTRLHGAIIAASAAGGFYITSRGFALDAEAFAATAPIKLVDGPKLIASIKRSMHGMPPADSYKAMCRQCGQIVTRRGAGVHAGRRMPAQPSPPCWAIFSRRVRRARISDPTPDELNREAIKQEHGAAGVKQQLAAVRMLFDSLVIGQVVPMNPAAAVRGPKLVVKTGKTPVLDAAEWRRLIDSIPTEMVRDLRDRALIATLTYSLCADRRRTAERLRTCSAR